MAASDYLNRFWLPQQREMRGEENALWGSALIKSLSGVSALAFKQHVVIPSTVNLDIVLGTEPPKRMQFDNVRSGLSQYVEALSKKQFSLLFFADIL